MKCEYRIVDPGSVSFHLNNFVLLTNSFPSLFVCLLGWFLFFYAFPVIASNKFAPKHSLCLTDITNFITDMYTTHS